MKTYQLETQQKRRRCWHVRYKAKVKLNPTSTKEKIHWTRTDNTEVLYKQVEILNLYRCTECVGLVNKFSCKNPSSILSTNIRQTTVPPLQHCCRTRTVQQLTLAINDLPKIIFWTVYIVHEWTYIIRMKVI